MAAEERTEGTTWAGAHRMQMQRQQARTERPALQQQRAHAATGEAGNAQPAPTPS